MLRTFLHRWVDLVHDMDQHLRELLQGTAVAFALRGVAAVSEFTFTVLLGQMLGADGSGIFSLAFTVALIGTVIGRLGLDNTLVRHVASHAEMGEWPAVKAATQWAERVAVGASLAAAIVIGGLGPLFAERVLGKPEIGSSLQWMALAVVPWAMSRLYGEMLRGLKRIFLYQVVNAVGYWLIAIAVLVVLVPAFGVDGVIWAFIMGTVTTAAVGFAIWHWMTPPLRCRATPFDSGDLLRRSLHLFWVQPAALAMTWIPTFFLGRWATTADVGIFSAAARTAVLSILVLIAVNAIAAPKFAAFWRKGDHEGLARMAKQSVRLLLLLSAPVFALFLLAPGWVMGLFGPEFGAAGGPILFIIAIGQCVNVATGSIGPLLIMSGHEKAMRNNVLFGAAINLALCLGLIPAFGMLGAAIATATSLAVTNLIGAYTVWSRLGILTLPLPIKSMGRLMGSRPQ
ncbi:MAG: flippase [Alphaproteobacteria bacterium]